MTSHIVLLCLALIQGQTPFWVSAPDLPIPVTNNAVVAIVTPSGPMDHRGIAVVDEMLVIAGGMGVGQKVTRRVVVTGR